MDHSVSTIVRDWKTILIYIVIGLVLLLFVVFAPEIAFYAALVVFVLGAVVLFLSSDA
ncbi:hypothetical protein [Halalkalicoccus subterraneus]|uniref:hypothetical protein n=1 Tax=Halalkalicoccus subterraneus TaxID=2675002 RepID=UPI0013CF3E3E|nr:hypothetical protein [Halalkalicoccus subterraneus]